MAPRKKTPRTRVTRSSTKTTNSMALATIKKMKPATSSMMDLELRTNCEEQAVAKFEETDFTVDGVVGNGKGSVFPKLEMHSLYNFQIPVAEATTNPTPWKQDPSKPLDGIQPTILSVVCSVNLGQTLDLKGIAEKGSNLTYNPSSFTPLVMRLVNPIATGMFFRSGKLVVTGTQSEDDCRRAVKELTRNIRSMGYRIKPYGMRIHNIAASVNVGFQIRVAALGRDKMLSPKTLYNPENFTGVSIALSCPKAKVTVFRTGSVLITGVRSHEELMEVFHIIYPHLKLYAI